MEFGEGSGMGRMRRVVEKTRSIETVFVEEILAGVAAVERLVSIVWFLTSIAIGRFSLVSLCFHIFSFLLLQFRQLID